MEYEEQKLIKISVCLEKEVFGALDKADREL